VDFSLLKKTHIGERASIEFRAQTTGAYRDLSNTNDPGGRVLEYALRFNF
jgi:hypothetical protein